MKKVFLNAMLNLINIYKSYLKLKFMVKNKRQEEKPIEKSFEESLIDEILRKAAIQGLRWESQCIGVENVGLDSFEPRYKVSYRTFLAGFAMEDYECTAILNKDMSLFGIIDIHPKKYAA